MYVHGCCKVRFKSTLTIPGCEQTWKLLISTESRSVCKMPTHRDSRLVVSMLVAQVPQVDGQLTQLVVPQVAVGQQDPEEGEGQGALTTHALLQGGQGKNEERYVQRKEMFLKYYLHKL